MIEIKNIRKEENGDWTKLVADIDVTEITNPFTEKTIWYAVKKEYADWLSDKNYNAFFLVPLYLAMYFKTTLKISGALSECLYRNMKDYGMQIFCNYSDDVSIVDVSADELIGYSQFNANGIGTGLSCGVDSLYTIYKRYATEDSKNYRITNLFIFNCGTHGDFEDERTLDRFISRYNLNKHAAEDLELPLIQVDSNLHYFTHLLYGSDDSKIGHLSLHSCILAMQSKIKKYYMSNSVTYNETLFGAEQSHNHSFDEFADPYFIPLVKTEDVELVLEGAQYLRTQKTEFISDWEIAKKHLNVCLTPKPDGSNCCTCMKCRRTLIPLDALGKVEEFDKVFDIERYKNTKKDAFLELASDVKAGDRFFSYDNYNFAVRHGMNMPSDSQVFIYRVKRKLKRLLRK